MSKASSSLLRRLKLEADLFLLSIFRRWIDSYPLQADPLRRRTFFACLNLIAGASLIIHSALRHYRVNSVSRDAFPSPLSPRSRRVLDFYLFPFS